MGLDDLGDPGLVFVCQLVPVLSQVGQVLDPRRAEKMHAKCTE